MELNPLLTLTLGAVFLACTAILFVLQIVAYRGAVQLEHELMEDRRDPLVLAPGEALASIVRRFFRGVVVAQAMGALVIVLFVLYRETALLRAILIVAAQATATTASLIALRRIRRLRDKAPVDLAGEAVVERDAESAAEVPSATLDVGSPVDDGSYDGPPFPPELDQGSAG